jgi:ketosteroid isomerase-like protein
MVEAAPSIEKEPRPTVRRRCDSRGSDSGSAAILPVMGSENVEALKRANAALNRGDFDGLAAAYATDAELVDRANAPDQSTAVTGRDAIREVAGQWAAAFEELRCDVDEFLEVGDAVICAAHWHGRGRSSGSLTDIRQYDVYELRDGEVIRATLGCRSEEEARGAAGIMD